MSSNNSPLTTPISSPKVVGKKDINEKNIIPIEKDIVFNEKKKENEFENKNLKFINNVNLYFKTLPLWAFLIPFLFHFLSTYYLLYCEPHNHTHKEPLYDILIDNIPNFSEYHYLVDIILLILVIPYFINFNMKNIISIFKYFSIIIFLRAITTVVTILPACKSQICKKRVDILDFFKGHCNDKIFSGHTAVSLIMVYVLYNNNVINKKWFLFFLIVQIFIAFSLIITRGHYTIDVLLSYFITGTVLLIISDL